LRGSGVRIENEPPLPIRLLASHFCNRHAYSEHTMRKIKAFARHFSQADLAYAQPVDIFLLAIGGSCVTRTAKASWAGQPGRGPRQICFTVKAVNATATNLQFMVTDQCTFFSSFKN
jgi:hypothetical protein